MTTIKIMIATAVIMLTGCDENGEPGAFGDNSKPPVDAPDDMCPDPTPPVVCDDCPTCPELPEEEVACSADGHSLWFSNWHIGRDFDLEPGATLTEVPGGGAILTGKVVSRSNAYKAWEVEVFFGGMTTETPPGSPKNVVELADWRYYTVVSGTLTGLGEFAGAKLEITRVGPAAQRGTGAAIHSSGPGLAVWFEYQAIYNGCNIPDHGYGDINIGLGDWCAL